MLGKVSKNGVLKVCLRQSYSGTRSSRMITVRDLSLWILGYQRLVSKFSASTEANLRDKGENHENTGEAVENGEE